jgi:hypothetical protein
MEKLKNRTCEIRAGDKPENAANSVVGAIKIGETLSESDDNLLNLIAEIVVENMVRKIRNESKQRKEMIKKE